MFEASTAAIGSGKRWMSFGPVVGSEAGSAADVVADVLGLGAAAELWPVVGPCVADGVPLPEALGAAALVEAAPAPWPGPVLAASVPFDDAHPVSAAAPSSVVAASVPSRLAEDFMSFPLIRCGSPRAEVTCGDRIRVVGVSPQYPGVSRAHSPSGAVPRHPA